MQLQPSKTSRNCLGPKDWSFFISTAQKEQYFYIFAMGSSLVSYHQIRVLATVDIVSEVVVSRHYLDQVLQDTP